MISLGRGVEEAGGEETKGMVWAGGEEVSEVSGGAEVALTAETVAWD